MKLRIPLFASLILGLGLSACSNSDKSEPTGPTGADVTSLSASPSSLSVARGASATSSITVGRRTGYTGSVTLSASGVPSGVTVSFSPATLSGSEAQASMTVAAGPSAEGGSHSITVSARGEDGGSRTTGVNVTITIPAISVSVSPAATGITQGQSATVGITVSRSGGFTGDISLSAEGLPGGLTASFAPAVLGAGASASSLTLQASEALAPGDYSVTVRASGSGVEARTAVINVAVSAAESPSVSLSATPSQLAIVAGESKQSTIALTRGGGFAGAVSFDVVGSPPSGISVSFEPQSTSGNSTAVTVSTTSAAPRGPTVITIRASGSGIAAATTALTVEVTDPPGIQLGLQAAAQSVAQGAEGSNTLTVNRKGGFAGAVTLAVQGLPTGVTTTLPATVAAAGGASSVPFAVQVASAVAPGQYALTLSATATGGLSAQTTLTLTVTAAGGFQLSVDPSSVTVQAGSTGSVTVTITRSGGFAGTVAFQLSGAPTGVTGTFNPVSAAGNSTQLTLAVGASVSAGSHTLQIRGTASGVADASINVGLTVTAGGGGGSGEDVVFRFCDPERIPIWFAYQDGNGAWTKVTAGASNTYSFSMSSATGGVAYVLQDGTNEYETYTFFNTRQELKQIGVEECETNPAVKTVNGSFTGLTGLQQAYLYVGNSGTLGTFAAPDFTIPDFPVGSVDLLAVRFALDMGTLSQVPDKAILRRNQDPAPGSTMAPFDFGSAEAFNVTSAQVTLQNAGTTSMLITQFQSANGIVGSMTFGKLGPDASTTRTAYGIPASKTQAGDFHTFLATTYTDTTSFRIVMLSHRDLANRTLQFGPELPAQTVSLVGAAPYARLRFAGNWSTSYGSGVGVMWEQDDGARIWSVNASRGYTGGGGTYQIDIPDLSGAGYQAAWGLTSGKKTVWAISGTDAAVPVGEGVSWKSASRRGAFIP